MEGLQKISFENRWFRHAIFWASWIIGFTFIKSFGAPFDTYMGWFVYYIITLPIFIAHTYLLVYWAAKKFLKGPWILLFIVLFILLLSIFSFIELVVTEEFLSRIFPEVFSNSKSYTDPGNIVISGIGNLYIVLVFAASKMIRDWYISDRHKQKIVERNLYLQRADANATVQPGMLLYSIEQIEKQLEINSDHVPEAIAMLSELLNAVMQAQKNKVHRVDEEARNVKKMLKLYALLLGKKAPHIRIDGDDLSMRSIPVFIIFSPLEIVCRNYSSIPEIDIDILIEEESVKISWDSPQLCGDHEVVNNVRLEMNNLYPNGFQLEEESNGSLFSMHIRKIQSAT
ncbi:hypothetical protein ACFLRQ_01550 [Bacteroidota bacterium]